ncbi:MAG: hypothetical protein B7733_14650 [Myxococcales bacterium FL481]|nr:MAG: hypothetical protein B7733_14650 [Myxococcales bacterium FL481]
MDELDREARELLAAYRADRPGVARVRRGWRRLEPRLRGSTGRGSFREGRGSRVGAGRWTVAVVTAAAAAALLLWFVLPEWAQRRPSLTPAAAEFQRSRGALHQTRRGESPQAGVPTGADPTTDPTTDPSTDPTSRSADERPRDGPWPVSVLPFEPTGRRDPLASPSPASGRVSSVKPATDAPARARKRGDVRSDPTPTSPVDASATVREGGGSLDRTRRRRDAPSQPAGASPPSKTSPSDAQAVMAESRLITRIKDAMVSDHHARALQLIAEHERRFPRGVMAEETHAWKATVLCRAGDFMRGRRVAATFRVRYPHSLHDQRVEAACRP